MLDRYMRAHIRLWALAPQAVRGMSEEEVAEMFMLLPPPVVSFEAWAKPLLVPAVLAAKEQKAEIDGMLSDPVFQDAGIAMKDA